MPQEAVFVERPEWTRGLSPRETEKKKKKQHRRKDSYARYRASLTRRRASRVSGLSPDGARQADRSVHAARLFGREGLHRALQLLEGAHLDLAHAFAADAVFLREILER